MAISKKILFIPALLLLLPVHLAAQEAADSIYGMKTLFLCFLNQGAKWQSERTDSTDNHLEEHTRFWNGLQAKGIAILRGPVMDTSGTREIVILEVDSLARAIQIAGADPLVRMEWLKPDVRAWYAGRKMIVSPGSADSATTYYFCLLVRGPKWTPEQTPEVQKLQEAHMANINALAAQKKLVLAGPFVDGNELRGVFIFEVSSIHEALNLSMTDPAVQAGRLAIRLHPWILPAGSFRMP